MLSDKRAKLEADRRTARNRVAVIAGTALASIVAIGIYVHSTPHPIPVVAWPKLTSVRPTAADKAAAALETPTLPPVRMKNPFDASEIFEFPAGTTREE